MRFAAFQEFFSEIASTETRMLTLPETAPGYPPAGQYCFIEMFCMEPDCDCRNAMIGVYNIGQNGQFTEVTKLRFCWEDRAFYDNIRLDFRQDVLPDVFSDFFSNGKFDSYFVQQFGSMCYLNYDDHPSLRLESDYAKRIKRHYSLFKEHMVQTAKENKRTAVGRNEDCPCSSGEKYKRCCGSPRSR